MRAEKGLWSSEPAELALQDDEPDYQEDECKDEVRLIRGEWQRQEEALQHHEGERVISKGKIRYSLYRD
jgi:hypothetical protein